MAPPAAKKGINWPLWLGLGALGGLALYALTRPATAAGSGGGVPVGTCMGRQRPDGKLDILCQDPRELYMFDVDFQRELTLQNLRIESFLTGKGINGNQYTTVTVTIDFFDNTQKKVAGVVYQVQPTNTLVVFTPTISQRIRMVRLEARGAVQPVPEMTLHSQNKLTAVGVL